MMLLTLTLALSTACGGVGLTRFDSGQSDSMKLGVDPEGEIRFGQVSAALNKSVVEEVVLYSAGSTTLTIIDVYLDESSSSAYSIGGSLPLPVRLEPGRDFPLQLRFRPDEAGSHSAGLVILIEDGSETGESTRIEVVGQGCEDPSGSGSCED